MLDLIDSIDEQKKAGTLERAKKRKKKKRPEVQCNDSESNRSTESLKPVNKKIIKMENLSDDCLEVLQSDLTTVIDRNTSSPNLVFPKIEANQKVRQFYC